MSRFDAELFGVSPREAEVLDRLPGWHNGFLWNDDSPLQTELGGAEAWAPEAGALVLADHLRGDREETEKTLGLFVDAIGRRELATNGRRDDRAAAEAAATPD